MMQTMRAALGGTSRARGPRQYAGMARQAVGFAIVASGLAVLVAQAPQRALAG